MSNFSEKVYPKDKLQYILKKGIQWEVLYSNWNRYNSSTHIWKELPSTGVIKVIITLYNPLPTKIEFSGWDVYWMEQNEFGTRVGVWKDEELSDPFYGKGQERFFEIGGKVSNIEYKPMSEWYDIPLELRKRGEWVEDNTARAMGV
jgi:hypothetical protein